MSQSDLNEEELLQRAGRRDVRAFEHLYDRMAPRLFGLLRQMLSDEREAENLLQDGFVTLWSRASSFDPSLSKAFTWAVMIFRNKAIDRMRMMGRRNRLVDSASLEHATLAYQTQIGAADEMETVERASVVREALDKLSKDQRQLIEFGFLKGLTHHVIAESAGLQLGTVKTNIRRGLLRLRELLKGAA